MTYSGHQIVSQFLRSMHLMGSSPVNMNRGSLVLIIESSFARVLMVICNCIPMVFCYTYCLNNPLLYSDLNGELLWFPIIVLGVIYGGWNIGIHLIQGNIKNGWDAIKYFFAGAAAGAVAGAGWSIGLAGAASVKIWAQIGGATLLAGKAVNIISTTASILSNLDNAYEILQGRAYTDESRKFPGQVWQGVSRYSWEGLQSWAGYNFTQLRNATGDIDRVDYLGGATFASNEKYSKNRGVSLGNYLNIWTKETISDDSFQFFTTKTPLYMHEYGHTFDSQVYGVLYLFAIGIRSAFSAKYKRSIPGRSSYITSHKIKSYERRANRYAARYFGKYYEVDWTNDHCKGSLHRRIEDYYPTN